jgi:hypothetical protein
VQLKIDCVFARETDRRRKSFVEPMQEEFERERKYLKEAIKELSVALRRLSAELALDEDQHSEVNEILVKVESFPFGPDCPSVNIRTLVCI